MSSVLQTMGPWDDGPMGRRWRSGPGIPRRHLQRSLPRGIILPVVRHRGMHWSSHRRAIGGRLRLPERHLASVLQNGAARAKHIRAIRPAAVTLEVVLLPQTLAVLRGDRIMERKLVAPGEVIRNIPGVSANHLCVRRTVLVKEGGHSAESTTKVDSCQRQRLNETRWKRRNRGE